MMRHEEQQQEREAVPTEGVVEVEELDDAYLQGNPLGNGMKDAMITRHGTMAKDHAHAHAHAHGCTDPTNDDDAAQVSWAI